MCTLALACGYRFVDIAFMSMVGLVFNSRYFIHIYCPLYFKAVSSCPLNALLSKIEGESSRVYVFFLNVATNSIAVGKGKLTRMQFLCALFWPITFAYDMKAVKKNDL